VALGTCLGSALGSLAQEATIEVRTTQMPYHLSLSPYLTGACIEDVNHEIYGGLYSQMLYGESFQEKALPSESGLSGLWRPVRRGAVQGEFSLESQAPFVGQQCQRVTFLAGTGELGVENQGLNHWGLNFVKGRPYQGCLWVRAAQPRRLLVALESRDGGQVYAEKRLTVTSSDWQRLDFELTPGRADTAGRFAIKLKEPGSVVLGYAFLQAGGWGRFKGLPDRKDVAEALMDQGIKVLRYGGSMVNADEYRWKKMIGPRDRRQPYRGTWHEHTSNGWGILDFLDFCEAAGFLAIPDFNLNETPRDMADFVEYVNGPADSPWGRKRAADGHPAAYHLTHLEIGNEERVDETYWQKFKPLAEAIWARDPRLTLVVGDFLYGQRITDPWHFAGAASGITSLAAHKNILQLAKEHHGEVWFDVHVGTEGPKPDGTLGGALSLIDALAGIADGARYRVAVFELNANNHSQRRALANALAINALKRDGRVLVATSANCLQPDGQNDNGWDQGLLFLNPSQVWLQPPGYVTRMFARNYEPCALPSTVQGGGGELDVLATRSEDGKTVVLQVVNTASQPTTATLRLDGFTPSRASARVEELAGPLDAVNTAQTPNRIVSKAIQWRHKFKNGAASYQFPALSFTVIRLD
jgi:hypothetical protein